MCWSRRNLSKHIPWLSRRQQQQQDIGIAIYAFGQLYGSGHVTCQFLSLPFGKISYNLICQKFEDVLDMGLDLFALLCRGCIYV